MIAPRCRCKYLMLVFALTTVALSGPIDSNEAGAEVDAPESDLDIETLDRMEKIADGYRRRGFDSHAEAILQDVFEYRRSKKGAEDPAMSHYHNGLGLLQAEQGNMRKQKQTIYKRSRSRKNTGDLTIQIWQNSSTILRGFIVHKPAMERRSSFMSDALPFGKNTPARTIPIWPWR